LPFCQNSTKRIIKPALGTYNTLSATTNPTPKKRFEAGRK